MARVSKAAAPKKDTVTVNGDEFLIKFDESQPLAAIPLGDDRVLLSLSVYHGRPGVDIRRCYLDQAVGAYRPTKQGVRFDAAAYGQLTLALASHAKAIAKALA